LHIDKCTVCKCGRKITIKSDYYLNNIKLEKVHLYSQRSGCYLWWSFTI